MGLWNDILNLIYPHKCFLCGEVLAGDAYLCAECADKLPRTAGTLCLRCGKDTGDCICAEICPAYLRAAAPLYFTGGVRHGIHRFKYDGRQYYATFLAGLMAAEAREAFDGLQFDFVTYVPLHRKKRRQRGFCQTELLARGVCERLKLPLQGAVLRHTGEKSSQTEQKGFAARRAHAEKSFAVENAGFIDGKLILLVDDVLTSGSTAHQCAELMVKSGAQGVCVLTAATTKARK